MRTGLAYMGHHDPRHLKLDLKEMQELQCDDVLLAAQENDFVYMKGTLDFFPAMAKDYGLTPLAIFWGVVNYFGGGKSSQFLLENPKAHQVRIDGSYNPAGCYNNPAVVQHIKGMIDYIAKLGFAGYFIDEPSTTDCYCASCKKMFEENYSGALHEAVPNMRDEFRKKCVTSYIKEIAEYIKKMHPAMKTLCCIMPQDKFLWQDVAQVQAVDSLGTDIYWVNEDINVQEMRPLVQEIAKSCKINKKLHHQWLQCWGVNKGREPRIKEQGRVLIEENPDSMYVWAYQGQIGTSESCADPTRAWAAACEILKYAKT